MPRFAANLTLLWPELPPLERFEAAARAGFRHVEFLFPEQVDIDDLEAVLRDSHLELVLFDIAAGDLAGGERGLLCLPGREAEFEAALHEGVELARRLGTPRVNALAGVVPPGAPRAEAWQTALRNLQAASTIFASAGVVMLIEAINPVDIPGYLVSKVDQAVALLHEAGAGESVRILFDQYHAGMVDDDPVALVRQHRHLVKHVQIADVPGRHQPGTGSFPMARFLAELDAADYDGHVALEYHPLGTTEESLAWLGEALVEGR